MVYQIIYYFIMSEGPNRYQQLILEFFPIRGDNAPINKSLKTIRLVTHPDNYQYLTGEVCRNKQNRVALDVTVEKDKVPRGTQSWDMVPGTNPYYYSDGLQALATGKSPDIVKDINGLRFKFKLL